MVSSAVCHFYSLFTVIIYLIAIQNSADGVSFSKSSFEVIRLSVACAHVCNVVFLTPIVDHIPLTDEWGIVDGNSTRALAVQSLSQSIDNILLGD